MKKESNIGITTSLKSKDGNTQFGLTWELHWDVLEAAAGFHSDWWSASAKIDFATGMVLGVYMYPETIKTALCAPHLPGPKSLYDRGRLIWTAHGVDVEPLKLYAENEDVDESWAKRRSNKKMSVELFDKVVLAVTAKLPQLLEAGIVGVQ